MRTCLALRTQGLSPDIGTRRYIPDNCFRVCGQGTMAWDYQGGDKGGRITRILLQTSLDTWSMASRRRMWPQAGGGCDHKEEEDVNTRRRMWTQGGGGCEHKEEEDMSTMRMMRTQGGGGCEHKEEEDVNTRRRRMWPQGGGGCDHKEEEETRLFARSRRVD